MRSTLLIVVCAASALILDGCGLYRGIPVHGGGKRFDEEQQMVAGVVRETVAQMQVQELKGQRVLVSVQSVAHDGGGSMVSPGINGFSASVAGSRNENDPYSAYWNQITRSISGNASMSMAVRPNLYAGVVGTYSDLEYLKAMLDLELRQEQINPAPDGATAILYVMVDVFGTNRSHIEQFMSYTEDYQARCEITYYAIKPGTTEFVFPPRQVAAMSRYQEQYKLISTTPEITRELHKITPMIAKVPTTQPATTQPTTQPMAGVKLAAAPK